MPNKTTHPPLLYAYVVRKEGPDLDGNQVVVARATELLKVSTGLVDKSQLGVGQYVWVHPQTYAIVEGSAVRNEGVIAKVVDIDRKSTRLNSSHGYISYAVFCLKKKNNDPALYHA